MRSILVQKIGPVNTTTKSASAAGTKSSGVAGVAVAGVVSAGAGEGGVAEATRPGERVCKVFALELVSGPKGDTKRGAVAKEESGASAQRPIGMLETDL
jgi:hypothetical protein